MATTTLDKPGSATKTATPVIFIDGEAGTTGIEIRDRLAKVAGVEMRSIDPEKRKDPAARKALMAEADLVVLCLPDEAAKEAVALAAELGDKAPRILDASSAHRVADGWTFGWPEMDPGAAGRDRQGAEGVEPRLLSDRRHRADPAADRRRPDARRLSGHGQRRLGLFGRRQVDDRSLRVRQGALFELYGLGFEHKHLPELQKYSKLTRRPIFVPSVGNFRKGMLVSVPLHLDTLPGKPKAQDVEAALAAHYAGAKWVKVIGSDDPSVKAGKLDALALNDTNLMELRVFGNEKHRHAVLVARLDNLGKGASGAAVQNIGLMLGVET